MAFAAVCDGVGGLSAGEVASSTVAARFARWFEQDFPVFAKYNNVDGKLDLTALPRVWTQLISELNAKLLSYGEQKETSLGTTITVLIICQGSYVIGHVGDCRAYQCSQGELRVLTNDQTLLSSELAQGLVSHDEAADHAHRNVLLQAIGAQAGVSPEFYLGSAQAGDVFLVCCDGLYRKVPDSLMYEVLSSARYQTDAECQRVCEDLTNHSMACGETDNITAVCLSVGEAAHPANAQGFPQGGER